VLPTSHSFALVKRLKYSLSVQRAFDTACLRRAWKRFPNAQELDIELRGLTRSEYMGITLFCASELGTLPSSNLIRALSFGELEGLDWLVALLGPSRDHDVPLSRLCSLTVRFCMVTSSEDDQMQRYMNTALGRLFDSRTKLGAVDLTLQLPIEYRGHPDVPQVIARARGSTSDSA